MQNSRGKSNACKIQTNVTWHNVQRMRLPSAPPQVCSSTDAACNSFHSPRIAIKQRPIKQRFQSTWWLKDAKLYFLWSLSSTRSQRLRFQESSYSHATAVKLSNSRLPYIPSRLAAVRSRTFIVVPCKLRQTIARRWHGEF